MVSRRLFLVQLSFLIVGCSTDAPPSLRGKLVIGVVSYGEGNSSVDRFNTFTSYLGNQLRTWIEFEPAYNELKALEQIQRQVWSLVLAPPGLAAIAIAKQQYTPLFPLEGVVNLRSVLVVLKDSPFQKLTDLAGKVIALGEVGSATGYYIPVFNLYGITLAEVRFAPTPKTVLEWVSQKKVAAGALSEAEFNSYRQEFNQVNFRILYIDPHRVPPGSVLVAPTVDKNQQEQIRTVMKTAPPDVVQAAGYIPNGNVPDYHYLIDVVQRVGPIAERIKQKPAPLYEHRSK